MPSVLHICTDFHPSTGGIEKFVLDLARRQRASGFEASVLCLDRIGSTKVKLPKEDIVESVPVTRVPFANLTFYKPVWLPIDLLARHDILHVHGIGAQLDFVLATKWRHRRPVVVSTHGGIFHTTRLAFIKKVWFFGIQRFVVRRAEAIVASSFSDQALFSKIAPNVLVIENAVNVEPLLALGMNQKVKGLCLYVGRLSENKGIPHLLQAFAGAFKRGATFSLRCVGPDPGGATPAYSQLAEELGIAERVAFVGEVSDSALTEEYARADVFVSASRYEGFGLSAVEAKAAGCWLVLQENEAFRANFAGDSAATLTNFPDSDSAAQALEAILSRTRDSRFEDSRSGVLRFSWESRLAAWRDLYLKVLNGRKPPRGARQQS